MNRVEVRKHNERVAKRLCAEHGCNAKQSAEHYEQIVNRAWNPHPSQGFIDWWKTQKEFIEDGVDAIRARNRKVFCDRFKEAREFGIA